MKGQVKICFGLVRYLINLSREDSVRLACQLMIFHTLNHFAPQFNQRKTLNLIEWTFKRECSPYLACNERFWRHKTI